MLMEHCSLARIRRVANELPESIRNFRFTWGESTYGLGASIGLVPITAASKDITSVLSAADSACYVAKDAGVTEYTSFTRKMH
jgi:PleD family two-component response regulator